MEVSVKAKFLEKAQLNGRVFQINKVYLLPYEIARALQKEGYCTFIEKAVLLKRETSNSDSITNITGDINASLD